jgi:hypothetical protein
MEVMGRALDPRLRRVARRLHAPVSAADISVSQGARPYVCIRQRCVRQAGIGEGCGVQVVHLGRFRAWAVFTPPDGGACVLPALLRRDARWRSYRVYSVPLCRVLRYLSAGQPPRFRFVGEPRVLHGGGRVVCVCWQMDVRPVCDIRSISSKYGEAKP